MITLSPSGGVLTRALRTSRKSRTPVAEPVEPAGTHIKTTSGNIPCDTGNHADVRAPAGGNIAIEAVSRSPAFALSPPANQPLPRRRAARSRKPYIYPRNTGDNLVDQGERTPCPMTAIWHCPAHLFLYSAEHVTDFTRTGPDSSVSPSSVAKQAFPQPGALIAANFGNSQIGSNTWIWPSIHAVRPTCFPVHFLVKYPPMVGLIHYVDKLYLDSDQERV